MTHEGIALGTPLYMSPEQVEADVNQIGPRSDVYSLRVMLCELLCWRRPYEGSVMKVLGLIVTGEAPAPQTIRPGLDADIERICMKAMARCCDDRYQSAAHLAEALADYRRQLGVDNCPETCPENTSDALDSKLPSPATATPSDASATTAASLASRGTTETKPVRQRQTLVAAIVVVAFLAVALHCIASTTARSTRPSVLDSAVDIVFRDANYRTFMP